MVSFAHPEQVELAYDVCQSVTHDNGAFGAWKAGEPILDWEPYYLWIGIWLRHPGFDWALIPDVIDGAEEDNDRLEEEWPHGRFAGVPVWHLHESLDRLVRLAREWPRIAFGSSGDYAQIATDKWWHRMSEAMDVVCEDGRPICKLHGLRMLDPAVFGKFPFSSADSTNVARNIKYDKRWTGPYQPANLAGRGVVLADRIEAFNSAPIWKPLETQHGFLF